MIANAGKMWRNWTHEYCQRECKIRWSHKMMVWWVADSAKPTLILWPTSCTPGQLSHKNETLCSFVHWMLAAALFIVTNIGQQPMCPSQDDSPSKLWCIHDIQLIKGNYIQHFEWIFSELWFLVQGKKTLNLHIVIIFFVII